MKNMERILKTINGNERLSHYLNKIEEVSLKRLLEDVYEIRFYVRFIIDEYADLSEYDAEVDEIVETMNMFLLPALRNEFIAEIKEVSYLYDDAEIVLVCESVE